MWNSVKNIFKNKEVEKNESIKLVVGLGNPGEKYRDTAHNSGFRIIKELAEEESFPQFVKDNTLNSLVSRKENIVLLAPITFMNLSGEAVKKAVQRFKVTPENIIIVHDDTDLSSGTARFCFSRGSAGHNGVKSIISSLKSKQFYRLRIGVREREGEALSMVLKNASKRTKETEKIAVKELITSLKKGFSPRTIRTETE